MARCAVYKCINGRIKKGLQRTENVVYHKFPKNPEFATLWWQAAKRRRPDPCKSDCICSEHFSTDSYTRDLQHELLRLPPRKRLRENAVPSLNLPLMPQGDVKKVRVGVAPKRRGRPKVTSTDQHRYVASPKRERRRITTKTSCHARDPAGSIFEEIPGDSPRRAASEEGAPVQHLQNDFHCRNLLRDMFVDEALMDVVLIAEDRVVKAHRAVLRQASGHFKQLLCGGDVAVESEVTLTDIMYEDLVKIIAFIYLGEVSVGSSNLCRFLKSAEKLEIFSLLPWSEGEENDGGEEMKLLLRSQEDEEEEEEESSSDVEITDTIDIDDYYNACSSAGEEHLTGHAQAADLSIQVDGRNEPLPAVLGRSALPTTSAADGLHPFSNESSHSVHLYHASYQDDIPSTFVPTDPNVHFNNPSNLQHNFNSPSFTHQSLMQHHQL